jgi:hypothetical protein
MEHGEMRSVGESEMAATPQASESMLMGFFYTCWKVVKFWEQDFQMHGLGRMTFLRYYATVVGFIRAPILRALELKDVLE